MTKEIKKTGLFRTSPYHIPDTHKIEHVNAFYALSSSAKRRRDRIDIRIEVLRAIKAKNNAQTSENAIRDYIDRNKISMRQELIDLKSNTMGLKKLLATLAPHDEQKLRRDITQEIRRNTEFSKNLCLDIMARLVEVQQANPELTLNINVLPVIRKKQGLAL